MKSLLFSLVFSSAFAHEIKNAEYVRNYDADTITVNIPDLPDLFGRNLGIRVKGIDSPELSGKKPCERELALLGKRYVRERIMASNSMILKHPTRGKYFRVVAFVELDGQDLGEELLDKNLAVPYGIKMTTWCDMLPSK